MTGINLVNMMKNVFATLGAKSSNNNYAVPLVDASSAEPKGYMNMSNLASVLGAMGARDGATMYSGDANDYNETGAYSFGSNMMENVPADYGVLLVFTGGYFIVQIAICGSPNIMFKYRRRSRETAWGNWN